MVDILQARPAQVKFNHKGSFFPPKYELLKQEVGISVAVGLAQEFNLQSTSIIVNQNATSTNYLSFRYFLPGEPFRYFDASIGVDQIEMDFLNPATIPELIGEAGRLWKIVFTHIKPGMKSNYFQATLHCETNVSTKEFLNRIVNIQLDAGVAHKGFSLSVKSKNEILSRMSVDVSDTIPDGLYVVFGYVTTERVEDSISLGNLFDAVLKSYRDLQSLAHIQLLEP